MKSGVRWGTATPPIKSELIPLRSAKAVGKLVGLSSAGVVAIENSALRKITERMLREWNPATSR